MNTYQTHRNTALQRNPVSLWKTPVVIAIMSVLLFHLATHSAVAQVPAKSPARGKASQGFQVGRILDPFITESSGIVPSSSDTNLFWTHNDGSHPILFGIDRKGTTLFRFEIKGVAVTDWEDIARDGDGHLYLGDIGNNEARRQLLMVHRFEEPKAGQRDGALSIQASWILRFPGEPFDCESLFIWKTHGYVISKVFKNANAAIYGFDLARTNVPQVLSKVAELPVSSPVTAADISSDGKMLGLVAKNGAYVFEIDGDVSRAGQVKAHFIKFREGQIEGCCFVPEGLLAVSEKREIFLFPKTAFGSAETGGSQP